MNQSCPLVGQHRTFLDLELFSDTEAGKYFSQQVVAGELAGDFVQRLLRFAQFFGHQFAGAIIL